MKSIDKEFELIRVFEKVIRLPFLDWTDQDYYKFEEWKEARTKGGIK